MSLRPDVRIDSRATAAPVARLGDVLRAGVAQVGVQGGGKGGRGGGGKGGGRGGGGGRGNPPTPRAPPAPAPPTPRLPKGPVMTSSDAETFVQKVAATLKASGKPKIAAVVLQGYKDSIIKYLTNDFRFDFNNLVDQQKNKVLWDTATFIENVLTDFGMSGGFWSNDGKTRFANNDVENLLVHRDKAFEIFKRTDNFMSNRAKSGNPPTPRPKSRNAFLAVVAKHGVAGSTEPAVLLVGEKGFKAQHLKGTLTFNIPGGGEKAVDKGDAEKTAFREFKEETGANASILMGVPGATLKRTVNGKHTAVFTIHVPATAEQVSQMLQLKNYDKSYKMQRTQTNLSNETMGWVWARRSAIRAAGANGVVPLTLTPRINIELRMARLQRDLEKSYGNLPP